MKKTILIIILSLTGLNIFANPIGEPTISISELYFDDSDNWKLELGYIDIMQNRVAIDSIFLYSTSDTVKLPKYNFVGSEGVFVITKDSLGSDFIIKRYADTVNVVYYSRGDGISSKLIFGNIPGASINYPRKGQSICAVGEQSFAKDNSPTIGLVNDTLGVCGTLKGIVYDKYLKPVQRCTFWLDFNFETSENGEYVSRVYSKPSQFKELYCYKKGQQYPFQTIHITEMKYVMEPDSMIEMNIYLLDTIISGIDESYYDKSPVQIFPNKASANSCLNVIVDLPVITSNIWLEMVDINGMLIKKEKIRQKNNLIDAPWHEGLYLLNVSIDNQVISSKKIVIKNE
jgi:hypothetical protein